MTELTNVKAVGEFVVLKAFARSAGTELKTATGIVYGTLEHGEIPTICTIHSIGPLVPDGYMNIGDSTGVPNGNISKVTHPLVAQKLKKEEEVEEKFFACHYKNLTSVFE